MKSGRLLRLGFAAMFLTAAGSAVAQPGSRRPQPAPNNPFTAGVGGDGRIVPAGGLIRVAAPAGMQGQPIVAELKVKAGDWVEPNQILAILRDRPYAQAQLDASEREKDVAKAAVARAEAGRDRAIAELQAQLAEMEGRSVVAEANVRKAADASRLALEAARREETAAKAALESGQQMQPVVHAVSAAGVAAAQASVDALGRTRDAERKIANAQLDQAKASQQQAEMELSAKIAQLQAQADLAALHVKQAEAALIIVPTPDDPTKLAPAQAEARTARLALDAQRKLLAVVQAERETDIIAARAQAAAAEAGVAVARAQVAASEIRAPSAGRILAIRARPGEMIGPAGVLEMGDTREIFVDALVYVDDVPSVHVGQKTMVVGVALPVTGLLGSVVEVSQLVTSNTLPSLDPTAFSDETVVLVRVRLDEPAAAANLINGRVVVRFAP